MNKLAWWQKDVVYQIYPRSFKDMNNDGNGDLQGIISELDYLESLGIGAIWLSPIYASPMHDNGYDVSNYYEINPMFGTMEDFELLVKEAKKRNIYIIMDLVSNHTSTLHPWFQEAIKDKNSKYHDFYYFRKTPDDKLSSFGGSAWKYVSELDEYYYHYFDESQADLNWSNPLVREEIANVVKFWLDKGCRGFRLDAIELIGKELDKNIIANGPKIHEYLHELNLLSFDKYDEALSVGEGWPTVEIALDYTRKENKELGMIFEFETSTLDWNSNFLSKYSPVKFDPKKYKNAITKWQLGLKDEGWPAIFLENHDLGRSVSRYGNDKLYLKESAKLLASVMFFLKGTIFLYQGEELGTPNPYIESLTDYNDCDTLTKYQELVVDLKAMTHDEFMIGALQNSRDNARCPMQWSDGINGGFNAGNSPWLQVNKSYKEINRDKQLDDPTSVLNFYKQLIKLRKGRLQTFLQTSDYKDLSDKINIDEVFIYERSNCDNSIIAICNISDEKHSVDLSSLHIEDYNVLISNYNVTTLKNEVILKPYETIILEKIKG